MTDRILNSTLGQYDVIEVLGHGGMATVYKAYQPSLGRFVAIKVLQHYHNAEYIARFKSEARSLALLQHPNILPVHDYGEQSGVLYLVLQLVPGGLSLANLVGQAHPPEKVGPLMLRLLAGLEYAHAQGIVHRDIKPANILMPAPDWPMLSDFGLSKFLSDSSPHLTVPGTIMGTVGYMPPEQATAQVIDARSDIYSTGVVLYQLLTGRLPFDGDTPMEVLVKHAYAPPPPPRQINPSIPAPIEQVILRAMAKSPADRYQTAAQMAAELKRIIERPPGPEFADPLGTIRMPIAPPQPADPPAPSADNPSRARSWAPPVIVALVLALILALAGGAVLLLWPRPAPPSVAAVATGVAPSLAAATSASAPTVPATQPPATAATGAVAVAGGATPSGAVSYSDAGLWSDTVTLSVRGLPDVSAEQVYAAWLSNASGSLYVGDLQRDAGDDLRVSYTSPIHQNLIGEYDQIFIAHVPKSAAAAEVANVVLSGALPEEPLIHLRHDLVSYSSTPGNIGYLLGLERELAEALVHAERLVKSEESGDLAGARSHAEHIVNIIEGQFGPDFGDLDHDGRVQNPGDGYGVLQNGDQEGYLDGGLHHVLLAAASPSAPEAISRGADAIRQLGTALQEQVTEVRDRALKVAAAQDVAAAREDATALLSLTRAINEGEGGAKAIYAQVQGMASVALAPVPVGTSIDAPPPVRIAAEAQPQVLIDIGDDTYAPNKETVVAGTTIVWKNTGASAHTVTAEDGSFNSKALAPGDTFAYTFTKAEAFPYYCTIHGGPHGEGMAGAVEVSGRPQTQGAQP